MKTIPASAAAPGGRGAAECAANCASSWGGMLEMVGRAGRPGTAGRIKLDSGLGGTIPGTCGTPEGAVTGGRDDGDGDPDDGEPARRWAFWYIAAAWGLMFDPFMP